MRLLRRRASARSRAQSLVEFALILPVLLMLIGGIVQYGMIFATKHSLIQVGRDLGRWAATQPCSDTDADGNAQPVTQANALALSSRLMGYSDGDWTDDSTHFKAYTDTSAGSTLDPTPPSSEAVEVVWSIVSGTCPPADSLDVSWVTIRLTHRAPVILPGFPYLPGLGTCDSDGCYFAVSTTAVFRMEPPASP